MYEGTKGFWEATYKQCIAKMIGLCYRYTFPITHPVYQSACG
ncbi:hypothetical protein [Spirosoma telluris]